LRRRLALRFASSCTTGNLRKKAYETYGQASEQVSTMAAKATEQVNTVAAKAREAVERGKEAYESARQSASGQSGGNGPITDFNRPTTGL
jgi:hypothetical protein